MHTIKEQIWNPDYHELPALNHLRLVLTIKIFQIVTIFLIELQIPIKLTYHNYLCCVLGPSELRYNCNYATKN